MKTVKSLTLAGALLLLSAAAAPGANAACFESGVGCTNDHAMPTAVLRTLGCEPLWTVRNTIYHEHGYCFRTARAQAVFSNDGCSVTDASKLDLNGFERTNIARIVKVERQKGCH